MAVTSLKTDAELLYLVPTVYKSLVWSGQGNRRFSCSVKDHLHQTQQRSLKQSCPKISQTDGFFLFLSGR